MIIQFFVVLSLFLNQNIFSNFSFDTVVHTDQGTELISSLRKGDKVAGYYKSNLSEDSVVDCFSYMTSNYSCLEIEDEVVKVSGFQLFYSATHDCWKCISELKVGDYLLTRCGKPVLIKDVFEAHGNLKFSLIEVENSHSYFVSKLGVLVHNEPISLGVGLAWAFGEGVVEFAGATILSGIAGFIGKKIFDGTGDFKNDAQAPGKPTEKDGYTPPKNWDGRKVKTRRGFGWPDKKGKVWIPTGPNGHGGPHWDVQKPDGNYDNVVPGGGIRGKR